MDLEKVLFDESNFEKGKFLIECLDKEDFKYPVILWLYLPDKNNWTLLFGVPGLKIIGKDDALNNIRRIISENEISISPEEISVIDSLDAFCVNLRTTINIRGNARLNIKETMIGNMKISEMVIYRIM